MNPPPGSSMTIEIVEQAEVIERLLIRGAAAIHEASHSIQQRQPKFALLVARGTSDNAALYGKYLLETEVGIPCGLASPSAFTLYKARQDLSQVLVVCVSQSGGSPDLIETMKKAREFGATTVAITNSPESDLAGASEYLIDIMAGTESAVAATKSYTAELLALWIMCRSMTGRTLAAAHLLPSTAARYAGMRAELNEVAQHFSNATRIVTTARGFNYPTAREAALKLMETCYISAEAFSSADLLHGPMASISDGSPVIAIAPDGAGGRAMLPVLSRLDQIGADTFLLGNVIARDHQGPRFQLRPHAEALSPIVDIIPLQLLALEMAIARGLDPDRPRGLDKVTKTR